MNWMDLITILFWLGYIFLIGTAAWVVITIRAMQRRQLTAVTILEALAVRLELKQAVDTFQKTL